jgi:serine/threonine protein kinase
MDPEQLADGEDAGEYTPPEPVDLAGRVLSGRYRLLHTIGVGGMATVYLGEQVTIGKRFAVKVMHSAQLQHAESVERFLREARAVSKIHHEHVIEVVDFGRVAEGVYMVMELLVGEDLCSCLARERRIAWPRARKIILQICGALTAAHAAGVIHRDLKPENCFLVERSGDRDFVKILDFGIAKVRSASIDGRALTEMGMVFGTPAYMSPEQADGQEVDARSDVYALGVVMFEMLTGRPPFVADTPMGFLKQQMFDAPPSPRQIAPEAEIPLEVEAVLLKALQKDPALRFQSMAAVAEAIEAAATGVGPVTIIGLDVGPPPRPRRSALWLAGGGLLLATVAVLASMAGEVPPEPPPVIAPAPVQTPTPPPAPAPSLPATVTIRFAVTPEAQVIDRGDGQSIGRTNNVGGLSLARSDQRRTLLLVAEGHEEEVVEIVPNADQTVERVLRRKKRRPTGKPSGKSDSVSLEPVNPFKKGKG